MARTVDVDVERIEVEYSVDNKGKGNFTVTYETSDGESKVNPRNIIVEIDGEEFWPAKDSVEDGWSREFENVAELGFGFHKLHGDTWRPNSKPTAVIETE